MMISTDIAIIGAGMAGASLAATVGRAADVLLIEGEALPGYHATGRSAAFWSETYGGPDVQPLTSASKAFLESGGFLGARGAVTIARRGEEGLIDAMIGRFASCGVELVERSRADLEAEIPDLRPDWVRGLAEPGCRDIDVAALHQHYLKAARAAGVRLLCDAPVTCIERAGAGWRITAGDQTIAADVVVNAAGAWASAVAAMAGAKAIPITPMRRTMVQIAVDPPAAPTMPLVLDAAESFYFKPEAGGRLWLSPHDESPLPPCDAAPDELDVAIAIDRLQGVVDWRVERRERSWAGLRSFAPDRAPIYGFDADAPGFFWFAGQGGFGIQTAPAAAAIGAALLLGRSLGEGCGQLDPGRYSPDRFQLQAF